MGGGQTLLAFASLKEANPLKKPPFLVDLLVSVQMKWTNAKSMFLVSHTSAVIPLSHCFQTD